MHHNCFSSLCMAAEELKQVALRAIDARIGDLQVLSSDIWNHPELAFQEEHAHQLLTKFLEESGFQVERSFGVSTAFRATFGGGRKQADDCLNIGVICEYDALPTIGHACGHNLIAEAGVCAALGLQAALRSLPEPQQQRAKVTVLGCPAEENGHGGKVVMIEKGCFSGVDCAMMVHPFTVDAVDLNALANITREITFTSPKDPKTTPTMGVPCAAVPGAQGSANALDAVVLAYSSLSVLRQQLKPTWRMQCIVSDGGGKSLSVAYTPPRKATLEYVFRTPTNREIPELLDKATKCFKAAAESTGCEVEIKEKLRIYKDVVTNPTLAALYLRNTRALGLQFSETTDKFSASTDMGNVSHLMPSIHPLYTIGTAAVNHTRGFTEATNSPEAHRTTISAGKAMAMTGVDLVCDPSLVQAMKSSHQ